jgi:hypothetical protein
LNNRFAFQFAIFSGFLFTRALDLQSPGLAERKKPGDDELKEELARIPLAIERDKTVEESFFRRRSRFDTSYCLSGFHFID